MKRFCLVAIAFCCSVPVASSQYGTGYRSTDRGSSYRGVDTSTRTERFEYVKRQLVGDRWWVVASDPGRNDWLYIAVSIDEIREAVDHGRKLFVVSEQTWPWQEAQRVGYVKSVWFSELPEPIYMLRADKFQSLMSEIDAVA